MVTTKYEASDIRKILTGMIIDRTVIARISSQWDTVGLFAQPWANTVGGMAVRHFRKFGMPPARLMPSIFEDWAKSTVLPETEVTTVEQFLRGISDERHEDSSEYILDLAGRHFNKVVLETTVDAVKEDLRTYSIDEAQIRIDKMRKINLGVGSYTEPGRDVDSWTTAFDNDHCRPLVEYRGELQNFIGDAFQRSRLFAFMAPDKTGKTTWLVDLVYRAVRQKNRVAFFDTGDGTKEQFYQRLASRASQLPLRAGIYRNPEPSEGGGTSWDDELKYSEMEMPAVDGITGYQAYRNVVQNENALRASFHSSGTLTVAEIDGMLADWDRSTDFRPDVLVIDYADILAPPAGQKDPLEQIDETWKSLHRIAQQRHCLVLTATQASALAYGKEDGTLSKKHFSGRKTKLAHVDGMLGINVTSAEKDAGMARLNWIVRRAAGYNEKHFCRVAGNMAIGNPAILSKR